MAKEYIVLVDKSGTLVRYPLRDFIVKSFDDIASDLGYGNSAEFLARHFHVLSTIAYALPIIQAIEVMEHIVSELEEMYMEKFEAYSNHYGE